MIGYKKTQHKPLLELRIDFCKSECKHSYLNSNSPSATTAAVPPT